MNLAFKTILVATDFDEQAHLALEYARVLAVRFGAGLRVVHVVQTPHALGSELYTPEVAQVAQLAVDEGERRLAEIMANAPEGAEVIGQVLVGDAAQKIVEYARDHQVDLIVMGTHGRRALAHLLMGSVAERVLRTAPCPVFVVRSTGALEMPDGAYEAAAAS